MISVIDLIWLACVVGGGAVVGACFWGWMGAVAGAFLGLALHQLAAYSMHSLCRPFSPWPGCRCGAKSIESFDFVKHSVSGDYVFQCKLCGREYLLLKM